MAHQPKPIPPARPFALEYEDAKKEIFSAVNVASKRHNVPYFLLEGIIAEVLYQVKDVAREEARNAELLSAKQLGDVEKMNKKEE